MSPTDDQSIRFGSFHASNPDTGESDDTCDIDVLTGPVIWTRRFGSKAPSFTVSPTILNAVESGDDYDAEAEQSFGEEIEDGSAVQTVSRA